MSEVNVLQAEMAYVMNMIKALEERIEELEVKDEK